MITPQNINVMDLLLGARSMPESGLGLSELQGSSQATVQFDQVLGLFQATDLKSGMPEELSGEQTDLFDADLLAEVELGSPMVLKAMDLGDANLPRLFAGEQIPLPREVEIPESTQSLIAKSNLKELLLSVPVEPTARKYKVLNSRVAQDRFEMDIVPVEKVSRDTIIKVSMPARLFYQAETAMTAGESLPFVRSSRVPVAEMGSLYSPASKISELFEHLNLKSLELHLETEPPAEDMAQRPSIVRASLLGELDGRAIAMTLKVPPKEIRVTRRDKAPSKIEPVRSDSKMTESLNDLVPKTAASGQRSYGLNQSTLKMPRYAGPLNVGPEVLSTGVDSTSNGTMGISSAAPWDKIGTVSDSSSGRTVHSAVRLTLPDSAAKTLQPNGKSITIRIEPENLGPAKLSLALRNDSLFARVSVHTVQARIIVESSLDQLNDQLQRAGIKVDSIEVTVSGGGAQNHLPERRPGWRHQQKATMPTTLDDEELEVMSKPATLSVATAGLHNSGGGSVNLLA